METKYEDKNVHKTKNKYNKEKTEHYASPYMHSWKLLCTDDKQEGKTSQLLQRVSKKDPYHFKCSQKMNYTTYIYSPGKNR